VTDAGGLLEQAHLVFSELGASQQTDNGFYLTGTLHFNEGEIQFENGYCRFYLSTAHLKAEGQGCVFDIDTIAFRHTQADTWTFEISTETTKSTATQKIAAISGQAKISLTSGIGASGHAKGESKTDRMTSDKMVAKADHSKIIAFVDTNIHSDDLVMWRIAANTNDTIERGGETYQVVRGSRLGEAANGLGYVKFNRRDGTLALSLLVRHTDIVWTEFEMSDSHPLRDVAGRLLNGRDKKAVIGRLALQKAIAGSLVLPSVLNRKVMKEE
jgi:hypothetical protein